MQSALDSYSDERTFFAWAVECALTQHRDENVTGVNRAGECFSLNTRLEKLDALGAEALEECRDRRPACRAASSLQQRTMRSGQKAFNGGPV